MSDGQDGRLLELIHGYMPAFLINAALRLEIPDRLGDASMTSVELAAEIPAHRPALVRVLRALAAIDVLAEVEPDRFRLTPRGSLLRADVDGSVRGLATVLLDETMWRAWPSLEHSVRTGEPAFDHVFGTDYFTHTDYFTEPDQRPELWKLIYQKMVDGTRSIGAAVAGQYDFGGFSTVVDVGGGSGALVAAILRAHPHLRGIVFDREDGVDATPGMLAEAGVADRCEVRTGDFFASVPAGDLYVTKSVIYNWADDEKVLAIFRNCRRAMPEHGRLLLLEQVLPARGAEPTAPELFLDDVNCMVNLGGRYRAERDYRELLAEAGFGLTVTALRSAVGTYSLLEAAPSGR